MILIASEGSINRCYFSGGDVTAAFCKTVQADGIQLIDEVMPIIAHGKIIGSEFNGLHIVTKGGLLDKEETLYDCILFFKQY